MACVKFSSRIGLEVGEGTDTTDAAANVGADLKFGAATCVSIERGHSHFLGNQILGD